MKFQDHHSFPIAVGVALTVFSVVFATPPLVPSYSVNVHFIPPLVEARCTLFQFWNPPNLTCGMCFCFTGRLSRCVPQPGCNPSNLTSTTTVAPGNAQPVNTTNLGPDTPTTPSPAPAQAEGATPSTALPAAVSTPIASNASIPTSTVKPITSPHVRKSRMPRMLMTLRKRVRNF